MGVIEKYFDKPEKSFYSKFKKYYLLKIIYFSSCLIEFTFNPEFTEFLNIFA